MKSKNVGYWTTTVVLALGLLSGGIAQMAHLKDNVEGVVHLGYPAYLTSIVGFWKVLGTLAILAPGLPRLKEWAYAGIFFELTGAAASYVFVGDGPSHLAGPLGLAALAVASWALRPADRKVGATPPGELDSTRAGLPAARAG